MTPELDRLLGRLEPASEANLDERLKFGLLCAKRVAHRLEQSEIVDGLNAFRTLIAHPERMADLAALAARTNRPGAAPEPPVEAQLRRR